MATDGATSAALVNTILSGHFRREIPARYGIRQSVGDLESIYTLNETAALVWKLTDGEHTLAEICDQIVAEYEIEPVEAQSDLFELVAKLSEIKAIVQV